MNQWNTYYSRGLNIVAHLPDLFAVRVALYDTKEKYLMENMLWRDIHGDPAMHQHYNAIERFGLHQTEGEYFDITFRYTEFRFQMEFACEQDRFVCKLTPSEDADGRYRFFVVPMMLWNRQGELSVRGTDIEAHTPTGHYHVTVTGNIDADTPVFTDQSGILMASGKDCYILCNFESQKREDWERFLEQKKQKTIAELTTGTGFLQDIPQIISSAMNWNVIYDPVKDRIAAPVARTWCTANGHSFGSYVFFEWDTFLSALMCGTYSKTMAVRQLEAAFAEMTPDGMIPNFGAQRASSLDRSQPPLGSYCLLKLYHQYQDRELVERFYGQLVRWNDWWMKNRDGNGDGLLEWGSNPIGKENGCFDDGNTMQDAMYESGLDNSPMYDGIPYNPQTHTMEMADVGLCALYALDCRCMARLASILEKPEDIARYDEAYEAMKARMNEKMYDDELGIYCNLLWSGEKSKVLSPTNFYPMLAGIPSQQQAERMVREHLLNPEEFWGEYVIPSVSRKEPAFQDQDYWRGRIWGPMNYLVYAGLREYDFPQVSTAFAKKSLALFKKEWDEESHIHENYHCITGDGDDRHNADAFYTWGALLAYTAMDEMIFIRQNGELVLGNCKQESGEIDHFPYQGSRYRVKTGADSGCWKDSSPIENK